MEHAVNLDLAKALRIAKRSRAEVACLPCRDRKSKCNDYRPCAGCRGRDPFECTYSAANSGSHGVSWGAATNRMRIVGPAMAFEAAPVLHEQQILATPGLHWQVGVGAARTASPSIYHKLR